MNLVLIERKQAAEAQHPGITGSQLRLVWALAARLRLNPDGLHDRVRSRFGVGSIREMSRDEASRLIRDLLDEAGAVTTAQIHLVQAISARMGWTARDVLRLARRMYSVRRLYGLSRKQASGLIEALKAMQAREEGHPTHAAGTYKKAVGF
jgi:hypothetical protein